MCGLAGLVTWGKPITPEEIRVVRRMMRAQVHRGPDDEGIFVFEPKGIGASVPHFSAVFGHRRLSILDRSEAGRQPMLNEGGDIGVVYNGEIYNFRDLRQELIRRGHLFRSQTDTEVLVHGYEEWGFEGLLSRLRGMFAFALYDGRRGGCVYLARDRLGEKPLYYRWDGRQLLFASEVKALLASGRIARRLDSEAVLLYLAFGSIPAPRTVIEGVEALLPGQYVILREGELKHHRYWALRFGEPARESEREILEQLRLRLQEAVRMRLLADVPIGVFLSGGIDSGAIVALMGDVTGEAPRTVSVAFAEREFDEGPYARLLARHFKADHVERVVTAHEVFDALPAILQAMDQPSVDGVNTYFVSRIARESGIVVALSGTGGDEVFGGYPSFRWAPALYRLTRIVQAVPVGKKIAAGLMGGLGSLAFARGTGRAGKLRFLFRHAPSVENAYLVVRGLFLGDRVRDLWASGSKEVLPLAHVRDIVEESDPPTLHDRIALLELRLYLPNQLLRDTDVMSMAHSIEVRAPFLDHVLVEFLARIPARERFAREPKRLLRRALEGRMPEAIRARPKRPFVFPFARWFRTEPAWQRWIEEGMSALCVDARAVRVLWQEFLRGREHWSRIWVLAVLGRWLEHHGIEEGGR